MNSKNQPPAMNQKIFDSGLSVETISVYLICCSLTDNGTIISTKTLSRMWNSTRASLQEGLRRLEEGNIIRRIISDSDGNNVYRLSDAKDWNLV